MPIVRSAWPAGHELVISGRIYSLNDGLLRDLACTRSGPLKRFLPAGPAGNGILGPGTDAKLVRDIRLTH